MEDFLRRAPFEYPVTNFALADGSVLEVEIEFPIVRFSLSLHEGTSSIGLINNWIYRLAESGFFNLKTHDSIVPTEKSPVFPRLSRLARQDKARNYETLFSWCSRSPFRISDGNLNMKDEISIVRKTAPLSCLSERQVCLSFNEASEWLAFLLNFDSNFRVFAN
jgi:hypothetical protein